MGVANGAVQQTASHQCTACPHLQQKGKVDPGYLQPLCVRPKRLRSIAASSKSIQQTQAKFADLNRPLRGSLRGQAATAPVTLIPIESKKIDSTDDGLVDLQLPKTCVTLSATCASIVAEIVRLLASPTVSWQLIASHNNQWRLHQRRVANTDVGIFRIDIALPGVTPTKVYELLRSPEGACVINPDISKHKAETLDTFNGRIDLRTGAVVDSTASGSDKNSNLHKTSTAMRRAAKGSNVAKSNPAKSNTHMESAHSACEPSASTEQDAADVAHIRGATKTSPQLHPRQHSDEIKQGILGWVAVRCAKLLAAVLKPIYTLLHVMRSYLGMRALHHESLGSVAKNQASNSARSKLSESFEQGVREGRGGKVEYKNASPSANTLQQGATRQPTATGSTLGQNNPVDTAGMHNSLQSYPISNTSRPSTTVSSDQGKAASTHQRQPLVEAKVRYTELNLAGLSPRFQLVTEVQCPELRVYASESTMGLRYDRVRTEERVEVLSVIGYHVGPGKVGCDVDTNSKGTLGEAEGYQAPRGSRQVAIGRNGASGIGGKRGALENGIAVPEDSPKKHEDLDSTFTMLLFMDLGGVIPPMVQNRIVARQFLVGVAQRVQAAALKLAG